MNIKCFDVSIDLLSLSKFVILVRHSLAIVPTTNAVIMQLNARHRLSYISTICPFIVLQTIPLPAPFFHSASIRY